MIQFQENAWTDRRRDRLLFYRTLPPPTAGGSIKCPREHLNGNLALINIIIINTVFGEMKMSSLLAEIKTNLT